MTLPTFGFGPLIAGYIIVASVLMVLCLTARLGWRTKAALILLGAGAQLAAYFAFPPLLGWPAEERMPRKFSLVAVHIQEPSQFIESAGEVYFWVVDLTQGTAQPRPRAYTLPFTPGLKAVAVEAAGKLKKNIAQQGEMLEEGEELGMSGAPPEDEASEMGRLRSHKMDVKFTDFVSGGPPPKTGETPVAPESP